MAIMRIVTLVVVAIICASPSAARSAPMATKLDTLRRQAATIVVGTLRASGKKIMVDVEYAVRGRAQRGAMAVRESPDGHVLIELGKPKRIVAFIDGKHRLRWVGRLIAGPSLERGVIRLHGFFDFNAHIVHPGVLTLTQLKRYLRTGSLAQTFKATLAFPDGRGQLRRSHSTFEVKYDAIKRKTVGLTGLSAACLGYPQLTSMAWGRFSLFLHCRKRSRSMALAGTFTGVETATGKILVMVAPVRPLLYKREFDAFIKDPTVTKVDRVVEVRAGGTVWAWRVGQHLTSGGKRRVLKEHGYSAGRTKTRTAKMRAVSSQYRIYRFDAATSIRITYTYKKSRWATDAFSLLQLLDAKAVSRCVFRHNRRVQPCTLRHVAPRWRRSP